MYIRFEKRETNGFFRIGFFPLPVVCIPMALKKIYLGEASQSRSEVHKEWNRRQRERRPMAYGAGRHSRPIRIGYCFIDQARAKRPVVWMLRFWELCERNFDAVIVGWVSRLDGRTNMVERYRWLLVPDGSHHSQNRGFMLFLDSCQPSDARFMVTLPTDEQSHGILLGRIVDHFVVLEAHQRQVPKRIPFSDRKRIVAPRTVQLGRDDMRDVPKLGVPQRQAVLKDVVVAPRKGTPSTSRRPKP
jgi:hypothetical protein